VTEYFREGLSGLTPPYDDEALRPDVRDTSSSSSLHSPPQSRRLRAPIRSAHTLSLVGLQTATTFDCGGRGLSDRDTAMGAGDAQHV
jgi:hypothetical protein